MTDPNGMDGGSPAHRRREKANRSAMKNNLLATRANGRTARGRRVRDLFRGLLARLGPGPHDVVVESHALRCAELVAIAEDLRARLASQEPRPDMINAVTRIESTARRAAADFAKIAVSNQPAKSKLAEYLEKRAAAMNNPSNT
jgi:hypothetical protein